MKRLAILLIPFIAVFLFIPAAAQRPKPKANFLPSAEQLREIKQKMDRLSGAIRSLRRQGLNDPVLADLEVYLKAAEWTVLHREYFQKESVQWTIEALNRGLIRAHHLSSGNTPWLNIAGRAVVRGYRSQVDGSVQPYAVTFPKDYGKDRLKQWRIDIVLHGRNARLSEVSFLQKNNGDRDAPADLDHVQIDIYGRGNIAYRWAGETDVLEAIDNFLSVERLMRRVDLLDNNRVVLRGFSMGGAGAWHLGLHMPSRWHVIGPGAGFTRTHGYVSKLPEKLPSYQEDCLHIYDAVDYAENASNVAVVAYGGSKDKQLQAAKNIQEKLKPLNIPMTLLIGKGLGHKFPPEYQKKADAIIQKHLKETKAYPDHVHFVTWTMKYAQCRWVEILGLEKHFQYSLVDANYKEESYQITTKNVRGLHLLLHPDATAPELPVVIDGQKMQARPYLNSDGTQHLYLVKRDKQWRVVLPQIVTTDRQRRLQKLTNLQGPIDDAFMQGFLCVIGSGKPWHDSTQQYAELSLKRFQAEWSKYLRGKLPIKQDIEVTPQDLATKSLILFGDPSSNSLIHQVIDKLPLKWSKDTIELAGKKVSSADHVPVMIYPSPLNAQRYVVLNSGHTFHASDFQGTNALLYPRLGDYALLKSTPTEEEPLKVEVITAGLFNDDWQLP